jgi:hypothetical protein
MGVGVRKISREAATCPRKKIVTIIWHSPSQALHLPEWETVRYMGFGVPKKQVATAKPKQ